MRLSTRTLADLPATVAVPAYDRTAIRPGIVHLGIGAFHRAHQAVYVDDCLAAGERDWGIVGASLRSADTRDALKPQDCLYTLAQSDAQGRHLRIIGAVTDVLVAPESPARLLAGLTDPDIRIVTLTITEKGYTVDLGTGGLRAGDPDIVHDLANPATPRTALGFLAEAIERRRLAGVAPFTILSCDNLPSNGKTLRRVLTDFAALRSADLAAHIRDQVRCPSSMVDRIVPATADADRRAIAAVIGVDDAWPVLGETFGQWVIEDDFPSGRPALERHGVEFTTDVEPFERMKLRMLNGAHTALAAIGRLGGFETVSDAMADPSIRRFIAVYWRHVIPTLTTDPRKGEAYAARLAERFDNATLRHRTAQIASDASQKLPQRILSPLRDALDAGLPSLPLIFAVAAWIRSCGGLSDAGAPLPLNDPSFEAWADRPDQRNIAPVEVMQAYLRLGFVFGEDLPGRPAFIGPLQTCLEAIAARGVMAALKDLLADDAARGA